VPVGITPDGAWNIAVSWQFGADPERLGLGG